MELGRGSKATCFVGQGTQVEGGIMTGGISTCIFHDEGVKGGWNEKALARSGSRSKLFILLDPEKISRGRVKPLSLLSQISVRYYDLFCDTRPAHMSC